jgi:hypothetical protein
VKLLIKVVVPVMIPAVMLAAMAVTSPAFAEGEEEAPTYGWKNGLLGGFKLTQAGFSNWAPGGENALAWQLTTTGRFLYDQEAYDWSNWFKLGYGRTKQGDEDSRKSVDEIKLESKVGAKLNGPLGAYAALYWETQFAKGYEYTDTSGVAISNFMDPGYFTESAGMSYNYWAEWQTRIGFAAKQTITNEFRAFSDDPDTDEKEALRAEYGAEWVTDFGYEISEKLVYFTRVNFFSNMEGFKDVDVKWDNSLAAAVAPYVDVTFDYNLVYDRDVSTAVQMRDALALGLVFKVGNEVE